MCQNKRFLFHSACFFPHFPFASASHQNRLYKGIVRSPPHILHSCCLSSSKAKRDPCVLAGLLSKLRDLAKTTELMKKSLLPLENVQPLSVTAYAITGRGGTRGAAGAYLSFAFAGLLLQCVMLACVVHCTC